MKDGLITEEQSKEWQGLLQKTKLTPAEKVQEAAFTEILNTRSLQ